MAMRGYSALSKGTRIAISVGEEEFEFMDVVEVRPGNAISLLGDLDLEVDFAPYKGSPEAIQEEEEAKRQAELRKEELAAEKENKYAKTATGAAGVRKSTSTQSTTSRTGIPSRPQTEKPLTPVPSKRTNASSLSRPQTPSIANTDTSSHTPSPTKKPATPAISQSSPFRSALTTESSSKEVVQGSPSIATVATSSSSSTSLAAPTKVIPSDLPESYFFHSENANGSTLSGLLTLPESYVGVLNSMFLNNWKNKSKDSFAEFFVAVFKYWKEYLLLQNLEEIQNKLREKELDSQQRNMLQMVHEILSCPDKFPMYQLFSSDPLVWLTDNSIAKKEFSYTFSFFQVLRYHSERIVERFGGTWKNNSFSFTDIWKSLYAPMEPITSDLELQWLYLFYRSRQQDAAISVAATSLEKGATLSGTLQTSDCSFLPKNLGMTLGGPHYNENLPKTKEEERQRRLEALQRRFTSNSSSIAHGDSLPESKAREDPAPSLSSTSKESAKTIPDELREIFDYYSKNTSQFLECKEGETGTPAGRTGTESKESEDDTVPSETHRTCSNCNVSILIANFPLHAARCRQHAASYARYRCGDCSALVLKKDKHAHVHCRMCAEPITMHSANLTLNSEEKTDDTKKSEDSPLLGTELTMSMLQSIHHHEFETCSCRKQVCACGSAILAMEFIEHQFSCSVAKIKCEYCSFPIRGSSFRDHVEKCKGRTIFCDVCDASIIAKDKQAHQASADCVPKHLKADAQTPMTTTTAPYTIPIKESLSSFVPQPSVLPPTAPIAQLTFTSSSSVSASSSTAHPVSSRPPSARPPSALPPTSSRPSSRAAGSAFAAVCAVRAESRGSIGVESPEIPTETRSRVQSAKANTSPTSSSSKTQSSPAKHGSPNTTTANKSVSKLPSRVPSARSAVPRVSSTNASTDNAVAATKSKVAGTRVGLPRQPISRHSSSLPCPECKKPCSDFELLQVHMLTDCPMRKD